VVPTWVWAIAALGGCAMLAVWVPYRRWRSGAFERVGVPPVTARRIGIASDICFGVIAVAWTVGGLVGLLRG
jgi:hypothetical protein